MLNSPSGHSYMAEYCHFICGEKSVLDISMAGGRISIAFLLLSHHLECGMALQTSFQQVCQVPLRWQTLIFFSFFFFSLPDSISLFMKMESKHFWTEQHDGTLLTFSRGCRTVCSPENSAVETGKKAVAPTAASPRGLHRKSCEWSQTDTAARSLVVCFLLAILMK